MPPLFKSLYVWYILRTFCHLLIFFLTIFFKEYHQSVKQFRLSSEPMGPYYLRRLATDVTSRWKLNIISVKQANNENPGQTAPKAIWSGTALFG